MNENRSNRVEYVKNHQFGNPKFYLRSETIDFEDINNKIRALGSHALDGYSDIITSELIDDIDNTHRDITNSLCEAFDVKIETSIINQLLNRIELPNNTHTKLEFLNYGDTQLVYLATLTAHNFEKKFVALINQPHTPIEIINNEFQNLQNLHDIDSRFVVKPNAYYSNNKHAVYLSPYIDKARCIYGGNHDWGMFDPEPKYHFETFTPEITGSIVQSMIAILVRYFDGEQNKGISNTQISGNDFMITQQWDKNDPDTILENMKLIAARETIDVSLDEYLNILRTDFLAGTHYKDENVRNGQFKVNCKSEIPISSELIERGIDLGLSLRK